MQHVCAVSSAYSACTLTAQRAKKLTNVNSFALVGDSTHFNLVRSPSVNAGPCIHVDPAKLLFLGALAVAS